jgi:hypothetical protein
MDATFEPILVAQCPKAEHFGLERERGLNL